MNRVPLSLNHHDSRQEAGGSMVKSTNSGVSLPGPDSASATCKGPIPHPLNLSGRDGSSCPTG